MIISRIHAEIKSAVQKLDSNNYQDIVPEIMDDIINFTTNRFIEDAAFGQNQSGYKYGFEVDTQRLDMLQSLVISSTLPLVSTSIIAQDCILHRFNLPDNYRHYVRINYTTGCKFQPIEIVQHGQLNTLLKNDMTKPSLIWERALGVIQNNTLEVYAPESFTSLNIEYIKNPKPVFFGGYDTLEFAEGDLTAYNTTTLPITSELPEAYHYLLVDLCAQEIYKRLFYPSIKEN